MEIDQATVEALARVIHENYLADHGNIGPGWADLPEDLREANRAQARAIAKKVASIGALIGHGPPSQPFAFTSAEVERLAKIEHRRWMAQRRQAGWIYAAVRNNRRKYHPMIIKWEKLPEPERDKDRDAVTHIPEVLARAGMHITRRAEAA